MSKEITNPLESLECTMATDPRDWGQNRRDAWLYGIVCGWENSNPMEGEHRDDAINEICNMHGFSKELLEKCRGNYLKLKQIADADF